MFSRIFLSSRTVLFFILCQISPVSLAGLGPALRVVPMPLAPSPSPNFQDCLDAQQCTEIAQGNEVKDPESIRESTTFLTHFLSQGIQSSLAGQGRGQGSTAGTQFQRVSGLAAGDTFQNLSAWFGYGHLASEDNHTSTAFNGSSNSYILGADLSVSDKMILGVALAYEKNDTDTFFNSGSQDIDGITIAPYLGYLLSDVFSFDLSFGYADYNIDQVRTDLIVFTPVTGDTSSDRWFFSGNLNSFISYNNWLLSGRFGLVYAEEDQDSYTESGGVGTILNTVADKNVEFGQIQIGGELAYSFGPLEPYFLAFYGYDFERDAIRVNAGQARPSNDRDDVRLGLGFRYFANNGFSGILEWTGAVGREDFESYSLNLMGRLEF